jgi:voltage-gated potassium channel
MSKLRESLYVIIFQHHTRAGRWFDIGLIVAVLASVLVVLLDSVPAVYDSFREYLLNVEIAFTILFSIEYVLRIYSSRHPRRYIFSFFGFVGLLALLPTYLALLLPEGRFLATIRILRILRVFRILRLTRFVGQGNVLFNALWTSRYKIAVFLWAVLSIVVVVGSIMYVVEGPESGFTSIPTSIYWAIVTLTTVGYGDISPKTPLGQVFACMLMIVGYGVIAVPTGIVTVELSRASAGDQPKLACPACTAHDHEPNAKFCKYCGAGLVSAGNETIAT